MFMWRERSVRVVEASVSHGGPYGGSKVMGGGAAEVVGIHQIEAPKNYAKLY